MNRYLTSLAALALLAACQDSTGPRPEALQQDDLSPDAIAPSLAPAGEPAGTEASLAVRHLWAVVNQNGTLARGSRVTGVTWLGTGRYEVTFDRNVAGCAYIATTRNAYSQALGVYTASGHLSTKGVYIETKNQGGGLTDGPFNLLVACGPNSTRFAVVGYSGNLVRATPGTTLTDLGLGRYRIRFSAAVSGCAYLATVADPANGLVYNPSGVYTGKGPDSRTVYIETKNPGGGLQAGVPFHLSLICPGTSSSRFVVVKANGGKQRGSTGTASILGSTGNYQVANDINISACAALATRGSVNTAVPFSPATVEITPGATSKSFGVQVRELLFFGGALANQAFHAAVVC
jgi:hypothetical protein